MKMHLLTTIFLFFIMLPQTKGQSLLTDGTEWHYHLIEFWTSGFKSNRCYIEGDTLIDQKQCKIYHRTYATCDFRSHVEYLYEEDQKLFYYDTTLQRFLMLYDYGALPGDTITLEYWPDFNLFGDSLFYIRVDSIHPFLYDTFELKKFYITYDDYDDEEISFPENYDKGEIIEGIGSVVNFFHFIETGLCDWLYNVKLRCFTYPGAETIHFDEIPCDSVTSSTEISTYGRIEVFPNPFGETVTIHSDFELENPILTIYTIGGRDIYHEQISGKAPLNHPIQLPSLPNGVYLLRVFEADRQLRYTVRLAKY